MIAPDVTLVTNDVDEEFLARALEAGRIAWDIETTGLDWHSAQICTVQVATADEIVVVQLRPDHVPHRLSTLITSIRVEKVIHHAPFDLRFMARSWDVRSQRVVCTKILSKILDPISANDQHSLKPVLKRYLDVHINKDEQRSDWSASILRSEQVAYAADDVRYLLLLFDVMRKRAQTLGVWQLACASFTYLPTRVTLDLRGSGDVFTY